MMEMRPAVTRNAPSQSIRLYKLLISHAIVIPEQIDSLVWEDIRDIGIDRDQATKTA